MQSAPFNIVLLLSSRKILQLWFKYSSLLLISGPQRIQISFNDPADLLPKIMAYHDFLFFIEVSSVKLRWQPLRHYSYRCLLPKSWSRSHETHSLRSQGALQSVTYGHLAEHMLLQPQPHEWGHDAITLTLVLTPDEFGTFECHDASFRRSYHNHLTSKRLFMAVMQSTSTVRPACPIVAFYKLFLGDRNLNQFGC